MTSSDSEENVAAEERLSLQHRESLADNEEPTATQESSRRQKPMLHETNIPRICCALLASITTGGTTYAFGLYGNALKKTLHLTQVQLDTISTANFCAGLLSWAPGLFVDRFGTRNGIVIGGITGASSLMLYWVVSKGIVELSDQSLAVAILSALGVTIFLSCALITGSVFKIISCCCGDGTKGGAVGVAKGYVGLGAGAYACLFESIRQPTTSDLDFLPMAAFFFITAAAIPSWLFLPDKEGEREVVDALTSLHFKVLYSSLFLLALLVVASSLDQLYEDIHEPDKNLSSNYSMTGTLLFVWLSPIISQAYLPRKSNLPIVEPLEERDSLLHNETLLPDQSTRHPEDASYDKGGLVENDQCQKLAEGEGSDDGSNESVVMEESDKSLLEMLQTPSAWLMLWIGTILVGGGTVETNNLGQMVEALRFPPVVTSASLALFSVAQAAGRVVTGALSEAALRWDTRRCCIDNGIPRPFFLVVSSITAVVAHAILAVSKDEISFVIGIALSGLAFGSVWPLMVLMVGELYGTAHVGANYMFYDGVTSAGGTFLLSKVVAQRVYESHIDPSYSEHDEPSCYGRDCFKTTHIAIAVLSLTCGITSAVMQYVTRDAYDKPGTNSR